MKLFAISRVVRGRAYGHTEERGFDPEYKWGHPNLKRIQSLVTSQYVPSDIKQSEEPWIRPSSDLILCRIELDQMLIKWECEILSSSPLNGQVSLLGKNPCTLFRLKNSKSPN